MNDVTTFRRNLTLVLHLLDVADPAKALRWLVEAARRDTLRELRDAASRLAERDAVRSRGHDVDASYGTEATAQTALAQIQQQLLLADALRNLLAGVAAEPWAEVVAELRKKVK